MNKKIESLIQNYQCPFINAIFLSNGEMIVLESKMNEYPIIRVLCKSSIDSFFEYNNEEYLISFDILDEYENEQYIVSLGEGSFGGDGIVYLRNKVSGKLIWFLFLDNSNPFNKAKIENDCILAETTKNISFKIPISKPECIELG